ncbi:MAG: GNAT family N-acetyltransferase [Gemmatimonadetes bacterium]|nr:GNAT family N-acetyltransferase [Gemmatimonadota bacterium]
MSTLLDAPRGDGVSRAATPPRASPLTVEEITSAPALVALRGEWQALWDRSPRATPFVSPDWLLAWWRHLGGGPLRTLAIRDGGRLAGLMPTFVWEGDGTRQLTPLGNGISDHLDLLAAAGRERDAAAAMLAHLAASEDWDTADFRDLPADSPLLRCPLPRGVAGETDDEEPCPVLVLPRSFEGLDSVIPPEHFKKLCYYRRRLKRDFAVRFETVTDEAALGEHFDALVRLHGARWAARGEPGVLDDPRIVAVHRESASARLAHGRLRMYGLRLDGRIAAVWYGFAAKGRVHYYLGGFDPALDRYSLGTVMVGHAIEQAVRDGAEEFDFLRGREPYKYAWGATDRTQRRLRLHRTAGDREQGTGDSKKARNRREGAGDYPHVAGNAPRAEADAAVCEGGRRAVVAATSIASPPPPSPRPIASRDELSFHLPLAITIRPCTEEDLQELEWYGLFTHHREIFDDAFARQERGETLMLLAVANGFPIGQAWIDFDARPEEDEPVALIWAMRVYPFLQGHGIGARLLAAAEAAIRARGCRWSEIGVEKDNPRARRLYERMGYRLHRELLEGFSYTDGEGRTVHVPVDEWMLRKELIANSESHGDAEGPVDRRLKPQQRLQEASHPARG